MSEISESRNTDQQVFNRLHVWRTVVVLPILLSIISGQSPHKNAVNCAMTGRRLLRITIPRPVLNSDEQPSPIEEGEVAFLHVRSSTFGG
jgi:hypothetical protein